MEENGNCRNCSKLKEANKFLMEHRDELAIEVDNLQAENEALRQQIADMQNQIPKPKPNVLGAGRKPKVTDKIIKCVLMLRADGLSFAEIANAINEVSDIKISRSTAYEIYDKHGRG